MQPADLGDYYDRRAGEYEEIYTRAEPEQERELAPLVAAVRTQLAGRRVLEVACGTGWWTAIAAEVASSVVATDVAPAMLAAARARALPGVEVVAADAYDLADVPGRFDAALACFWFSHVPRSRRAAFLAGLHRRLAPGAAVLLADNVYVEGLGGELVRPPGEEDTFKRRRLRDGSEHLVLKNYDSREELNALLAPLAAELQLEVGTRYWWAAYRLP
jgi:SAM-dependent methyltransferase